jgi:hypothetical protein
LLEVLSTLPLIKGLRCSSERQKTAEYHFPANGVAPAQQVQILVTPRYAAVTGHDLEPREIAIWHQRLSGNLIAEGFKPSVDIGILMQIAKATHP